MTRWELFVDESGRFDGDEPAVVAGALFRKPVSRGRLRAAFEHVFGGFFPPHATELRTLGGVLTALIAAGRPPSGWDVVLESARAAGGRTERGARAIGSGSPADRLDLERFDDWLRSSIYTGVRQQLATVRDEMSRGVLAISQHLEAQAQLVVVAAASYDGGYYAGRERGEVVVDRYLSALRVVFERVVLLAREARVPRVELTIASRSVLHRQLGKPINLRPSDVGSAIQDTIGYPYLDEVDGFEHRGVRFVVQSTPTYDEHVHPGVVVADFASNRLLGRVHATTHRLSKMESNSFGPLSIPFRGVRVPLLACDGEPSQLLRDGLRGSDVASALGELPVDWRREQVERWLEVAR